MAGLICETNDKLLHAVINELNLDNCEVYEVEGSKKGDNYVGVIRRICVKGTQENGKPYSVNLIYKQAPTDEHRRIGWNVELCFNREIYIYETVLPIFSKLEEDNGVSEKLRYASLYGTSRLKGLETLIFEDLSVDGFKMRDRKDTLDWEHCKLSIKYLAHLHSLSFVLKKKNPELFSQISDISEPFFNARFLMYYKTLRLESSLIRAYSCLDPEKEKHYIDKLKYIGDNFMDIFKSLFSDKDEYFIISHGDCWTNNIFYKYKDEENKNPIEVCFIDFQHSRYSSPLIDIIYFIYASSTKQFRDEHLNDVFETYYSSLSYNLELFGESIEDHFPKEEFEKHKKKYMIFAILIAIMALHIFMLENSEIFTPEEIMKKKDEFEDMLMKKAKNDKNYKERVHDIIVEVCNGGYL